MKHTLFITCFLLTTCILSAQDLVRSAISGQELFSCDGKAYFSTYNSGPGNTVPWFSDGTAAGTIELSATLFSPLGFVKAGSNVFFGASDSAGNSALYRTNGTVAGTQVVKDANNNDVQADFVGSTPVAFAGKLIFTTSTGNAVPAKISVTDGTSAGTKSIASLPTPYNSFAGGYQVTANDKVVYLANTTAQSPTFDMYAYDGTSNTKLTLVPVTPFANGATALKLSINGYVYYAYENANPFELRLLKSNGTNCLDVVFLPVGTRNFTATSTDIYFQQFKTATGAELYRSDLDFNNITLVKDINPTGGSFPSGLVVLNNILYFFASDGTAGVELWRSDGTAAGTYMVKDINPGSNGSSAAVSFTHMPAIFVCCGKLYFNADDGVHGSELWSSDGTEAGTQMVHDLAAGATSSNIQEIAVSDGRIYLFATDSAGIQQNLYKMDVCYTPPTGLDETGKTMNGFSIFPNPCTTCSISGDIKTGDLLVTDLVGRVIPVQFIKTGKGFTLEFDHDAPGLYLVHDRKTGEVHRFLKE